jgi:hypothetical protein
MKTKENKLKNTTDTVVLRNLRDILNKEIQNMSNEELLLYFKNAKTLHPRKKWSKFD